MKTLIIVLLFAFAHSATPIKAQIQAKDGFRKPEHRSSERYERKELSGFQKVAYWRYLRTESGTVPYDPNGCYQPTVHRAGEGLVDVTITVCGDPTPARSRFSFEWTAPPKIIYPGEPFDFRLKATLTGILTPTWTQSASLEYGVAGFAGPTTYTGGGRRVGPLGNPHYAGESWIYENLKRSKAEQAGGPPEWWANEPGSERKMRVNAVVFASDKLWWSYVYELVDGGNDSGGQEITWATQADNLRGRNGQRFTYHCPPGTVSTRLWGVDLYTDDSSICTAAAHAGLINAQSGGTVTIEIRAGANAYQGTTRNGVKSSGYGSWHGSFVFVGGSPPRTDLGNLWRIREANPQGQGCDGVWRRRPGTQIFDARWQCLGGTVVDVVRIESVTGTQVIVYREGSNGRYTLTLSPDGRRIIAGRIAWAPGWTFTGTIE